MKVLKNTLVIVITINIIGLISLIVLYFTRFHAGFSLNPEHWYAAGSFLVGFLSLLVTIIIAVYVSEITKQSTRFPEQRKIYSELMIMDEYVFDLFHSNLSYMDFQVKTDTLIRRLNVLKGESFIFNDNELYEEALIKYRDKLDSIRQKVSQIFMENSSKYIDNDNARLGQIKLIDINQNIFDEFIIIEEAKYLKKSIIKAMK